MLPALFLALLAAGGSALVTLEDVRQLTNVTRECRERVVNATAVLGGVGRGQAVVDWRGGRDDDDDEVEDTVAAALKTVDNSLVQLLNVPLDKAPEKRIIPCLTIRDEYHSFLEATTLFLRAVEEQQQLRRWGGISPVFDALTWMQALWASRKVNERNRSFIEQQMLLYGSTDCFGSNEVLKRGVELVEYMNDMIDSFDA